MQTDPSYLSSDEDSEIQYHFSDRGLISDRDEYWLNQVLIQPNDLTDLTKVTIPRVHIDMPTLSHSATTDWQQDKNMHNVSPISDDIFLQPGPQPIELK